MKEIETKHILGGMLAQLKSQNKAKNINIA